jgi:hypothetical protein
MDFSSPPPDPKDFLRFEDYQKALKIHEEFHDRVGNVSSLRDSTDNEDDFRKGMEALGFTYYEDEKCGNPWCEEYEWCMAELVDQIQYMANSHLFWDLLTPQDKIFPNTKKYESPICGELPRIWFDKLSKENRAIMSYEDTYMEILWYEFESESYREELKNNEHLQELMQEMYFTLQTILRGYAFEITEQHRVKFFDLLNQVFRLEFAKLIVEKWNF